jgi:predicted nucleic acid-binding protein
MTRERVVIDTNVLISGLFSTTSTPARGLVEIIEVLQSIRTSRDPTDDKFLEAAMNGRADVIVTGDKDLLDLNPFRGIAIVTPADYLARET